MGLLAWLRIAELNGYKFPPKKSNHNEIKTQRANPPLYTWYTLMKNIFVLSLALLAAPVTYADFQGKVIKVADGDTITVLVNLDEEKEHVWRI
ncbi:hypothetical protein ACT4WO_20040 (plasmid) [Acinetobacter baumannii]